MDKRRRATSRDARLAASLASALLCWHRPAIRGAEHEESRHRRRRPAALPSPATLRAGRPRPATVPGSCGGRVQGRSRYTEQVTPNARRPSPLMQTRETCFEGGEVLRMACDSPEVKCAMYGRAEHTATPQEQLPPPTTNHSTTIHRSPTAADRHHNNIQLRAPSHLPALISIKPANRTPNQSCQGSADFGRKGSCHWPGPPKTILRHLVALVAAGLVYLHLSNDANRP